MHTLLTKIFISSIMVVFSVFWIHPAITGAEGLYVWKDKDGHLHITDRPPPENARLVDNVQSSSQGSPREVSDHSTGQEEKDAGLYWEAMRNAEDLRKRVEAARNCLKRKQAQEDALCRAAEEASVKAEDFSKKGGSKKKRRWYRRQAEKYRQQAEQAADEAKKLEIEIAVAAQKVKAAEEEAKQAEAEAARLSQP